MSTPHNEANLGDIAKTVIMPGDPLRAKHIAEKYLKDYKLVNSVRNNLAYTGTYEGKEITVMSSGMGMPSMGIYCYELYKFYGVENIIRIGTCGGYDPDLELFDIVLPTRVFSESNIALTFNNDECHIVEPDKYLNELLEATAKEQNIKISKGDTATTTFFDKYIPHIEKLFKRIPEYIHPIAAEMENFALLYVAKYFNKRASCMMTVVDSEYTDRVATPEERELGLDKMVKLILDATLKI